MLEFFSHSTIYYLMKNFEKLILRSIIFYSPLREDRYCTTTALLVKPSLTLKSVPFICSQGKQSS